MIDACMHTCGVRRTGQTTLFVLKVVQTKQPTQIAVQATPLVWTHRSKEEENLRSVCQRLLPPISSVECLRTGAIGSSGERIILTCIVVKSNYVT